MKNDDLSWLCAELGLPVLEETETGLLLANPAAQLALESAQRPGAGVDEVQPQAGLAANAARVLGVAADHEALLNALACARRGEVGRAEISPGAHGGSWKVLATPLDGARVRITCAPHGAPANSESGWVEVAAAVSHEVANAVGSIRGWADLALHGGDATVDVRDALTLIRSAARNAEQAARSMLRLARGQVESEEENVIDLSEFAGEMMSLLTLGAREQRVTLQSAIEPGLFVRATRAQLFTMLFNLLKNGIEACKQGGLVSLTARGTPTDVHVMVRDTGAGLDAEERQRLFQRYFTTKATGTGLGLSLVKGAADASGSAITVESERGRGTAFLLAIPRAHAAALAAVREPGRKLAEPAGHEAPIWRGPAEKLNARVLLVDDDHALREMLATGLTLRGAQVVIARDADEAIAHDGPFDIALIDMVLGGCRGDELLARLRKRGSVNAAMLVTGAVQKPRLVLGGEPDDWVRKPFELAHLVDRIRRTLERHRMLQRASTGARL